MYKTRTTTRGTLTYLNNLLDKMLLFIFRLVTTIVAFT
jgi:hypothetical protein